MHSDATSDRISLQSDVTSDDRKQMQPVIGAAVQADTTIDGAERGFSTNRCNQWQNQMQPVIDPPYTQMQPVIVGGCDTTSDGADLHSDATIDGAAEQPDSLPSLQPDSIIDGAALLPYTVQPVMGPPLYNQMQS